MATYHVYSKNRVWEVHKVGFFGTSRLESFIERQAAIEYVKKVGAANRPSIVKVYDYKGNERSSWEYGKNRPPFLSGK